MKNKMFLIDQLADCLGCKPLHELLDLTIPNFESVYQSVTYSNRLRIFSNRNRLGIFWVFFESVRIGSNRLVFSNIRISYIRISYRTLPK